MASGVGSVAETLGTNVLWSDLGGGELVLALIVGLVLLAFAFPARLSEKAAAERDGPRVRDGRLSHR